MEKSVYRFSLDDSVDMALVEEILLMAVISSEGMYGRARVDLEAQYRVNPSEHTCTVSSDSEVGQAISRIFTEMLILELGEGAFKAGRYALELQD